MGEELNTIQKLEEQIKKLKEQLNNSMRIGGIGYIGSVITALLLGHKNEFASIWSKPMPQVFSEIIVPYAIEFMDSEFYTHLSDIKQKDSIALNHAIEAFLEYKGYSFNEETY